MQPSALNQRSGTLAGIGAIVLWSSTIALVRSSSEQLGPLTSASAVYLVGGGLALLNGWRTRAIFRCHRELSPRYLVFCGGLFALYTLLLFLAVGLARTRLQVVEVGLLNYLWPALTLVFSLGLLGARANVLFLPGTAIALTGVALVMTQGTDFTGHAFVSHLRSEPAPYALATLAAIAWALYSNLGRRWAGGTSAGAVELFLPVTGLMLLTLRLATNETSQWTARSMLEVVALGGLTALAYGLWDLAMRRGNLLLVAACSYATPLLSTLVSCVYLGVVPGPRLWIGCGLLTCGSLLSWRSLRPPPRPPRAEV